MWSRTHTAPGLALSSPSPLPPRTLDEWGTDQTTAWDCKCLIVFFLSFWCIITAPQLCDQTVNILLQSHCFMQTDTGGAFSCRQEIFIRPLDPKDDSASDSRLKPPQTCRFVHLLCCYFVLAFIRTSADVAWLTEVRYWKVRKSNVIACTRQIIFLQKRDDNATMVKIINTLQCT